MAQTPWSAPTIASTSDEHRKSKHSLVKEAADVFWMDESGHNIHLLIKHLRAPFALEV